MHSRNNTRTFGELPLNGTGGSPQPSDEATQFLELSESQFQSFLKTLAKSAGCMAELSPRLGVSAKFYGDVCAGRKRAGRKLLAALGARVERIYVIPIEAGSQEVE